MRTNASGYLTEKFWVSTRTLLSCRAGPSWGGLVMLKFHTSFPCKRVPSNQPLHVHFECGIALMGNVSFWKCPPAICSNVRRCCVSVAFLMLHSIMSLQPLQEMTHHQWNPACRPLCPLPLVQSQGREVHLGRGESQASSKACAWQSVSHRREGHVGHFALGTSTGWPFCLPRPTILRGSEEPALGFSWSLWAKTWAFYFCSGCIPTAVTK